MLQFSEIMDNSINVSFRRVLILVLAIIASGATGLRDVRITVPAMVRSRDSALLTCDYDLEGADLYSIKWYHEEEEFYRYVPKEAPPQVMFTVRDIQIDIEHSNAKDVTLVNVSRKLAGKYRCEISADAPSFHTVIKTAPMDVVDVPETDPSIESDRQRLPAGETLRANCTSGGSSHAPTVTWALNGDPLNDTTLSIRTQSYRIGSGGLQATKSNLELRTSGEMFKDGKLTLRCFAAISTIYRATAELVVAEDTPLIASITGNASPHLRQSSGCGKSSPLQTVVLLLFLTAIGFWSR